MPTETTKSEVLELLTVDQVAEVFSVKRKTIERWVTAGVFPSPLRIGGKTLRFRARDVIAFINDQYPEEKGE